MYVGKAKQGMCSVIVYHIASGHLGQHEEENQHILHILIKIL